MSIAEEIYERHVRPQPVQVQRRLAEVIQERLGSSNAQAKQKDRSLLELEGLGEELWKGVDAQRYVDELRQEWDHRP